MSYILTDSARHLKKSTSQVVVQNPGGRLFIEPNTGGLVLIQKKGLSRQEVTNHRQHNYSKHILRHVFTDKFLDTLINVNFDKRAVLCNICEPGSD